MNEYYFSLTTIPSRFEKIHSVIESLYKQTIQPTKIFLNLPKQYRRLFSYSLSIEELQTSLTKKFDERLIINLIEKDYGSNTKFLPMLLQKEIQDESPIIIVDDDFQYDSTLAETLLELSSRHENSACCIWGVTNIQWFINRTWNCLANSQNKYPVGFRTQVEGYIDAFEGFCGVLLKKKFFTENVFDIPCEEAYFCDDIWLSANVIKNGFSIVTSGKHLNHQFLQDEVDALKNDELKFVRDNKTAMLCKILFNIY